MADVSTRDVLLSDPLAEVTRKERRMLLATSLLGVGLVRTGLVPTKIAALGVEFDKANQQALLFLLAVVVAYFLAAFVIYAVADFWAWRRALEAHDRHRMLEYIESRKAQQEDGVRLIYEEAASRFGPHQFSFSRALFRRMATPIAVVRALFEFVLPLAVGGYAVSVLWLAGGRI